VHRCASPTRAGPLDFAIDTTTAFFHTPTGGDMVAAPLTGGPLTTLVPNARAFSIATDATYVYWADPFASSIGRVAKTGGHAKIVAHGHGALAGVTVDEGCVYWLDENNTMNAVLARAPK
jgi:hypothetical protein